MHTWFQAPMWKCARVSGPPLQCKNWGVQQAILTRVHPPSDTTSWRPPGTTRWGYSHSVLSHVRTQGLPCTPRTGKIQHSHIFGFVPCGSQHIFVYISSTLIVISTPLHYFPEEGTEVQGHIPGLVAGIPGTLPLRLDSGLCSLSRTGTPTPVWGGCSCRGCGGADAHFPLLLSLFPRELPCPLSQGPFPTRPATIENTTWVTRSDPVPSGFLTRGFSRLILLREGCLLLFTLRTAGREQDTSRGGGEATPCVCSLAHACALAVIFLWSKCFYGGKMATALPGQNSWGWLRPDRGVLEEESGWAWYLG